MIAQLMVMQAGRAGGRSAGSATSAIAANATTPGVATRIFGTTRGAAGVVVIAGLGSLVLLLLLNLLLLLLLPFVLCPSILEPDLYLKN